MSQTLSVVIPTCNRNQVLIKTLSFLSRGSVIPDEVIIVDDASDVAVRSFVDPAKYPFSLKIIRHDVNRGASAARNTGIRSANGYLLLLMDDDIWPDHEMIHYHKYMHKVHPSEKYGISGRVIFDPELIRTPLLHFLEEHGAYRGLSKLEEGELFSSGIITANISFKKSFLDKSTLFDEDFPFNRNEDTEFGLRLMNMGFEPRFHNAPSARHHSFLTLENYYRILIQNGHSKAYWTSKKPDDTHFCHLFPRIIRHFPRQKQFKKLYKDIIIEFGDDFLNNDIYHSPPYKVADFNIFMKFAQGWIQNMGMLERWGNTISGFSNAIKVFLEAFSSKNRSKSIELFRIGYKETENFFPSALLFTDQLKRVGHFKEALEVIEPYKHNIWAKIKTGELFYSLKEYQKSYDTFIEVIENTNHGKLVENVQRGIARDWIRKLGKKLTHGKALLKRETVISKNNFFTLDQFQDQSIDSSLLSTFRQDMELLNDFVSGYKGRFKKGYFFSLKILSYLKNRYLKNQEVISYKKYI